MVVTYDKNKERVMEDILFQDWRSILRIIVISLCAYLVLIFLLSLSGKRALGQMNAFDFVVTVAIGSTLSSVIISKDVTLAEGVTALGMLILLQYVLTRISLTFPAVEKLVKARPSPLVKQGEMLKDCMHKERVTQDEIYSALRQGHMDNLEQVKSITLEANGQMTVVYKER
jgi:uncharacterized membrane protein YcaP (DUF421 family)